jgi:hypothetical protein
MVPLQTTITSLNSINQLIFVMMKCVLFVVGTEFLNVTYTSFDSHTTNRPALSSHDKSQCYSQAYELKSDHESQKAARHQDRLANGPSVAK